MPTTTETSDEVRTELLPGYWVDPKTGAWCSIPWPTDPEEKARLSRNSLGPLLIRWAENRLSPEEFEEFGPGLIHPDTGADWRFTDGQKRFLILWYSYDPATGLYVYRRAVKRGAKGTGKDPFAAAHGNIELAGPSQLVWDDEIGAWTGRKHRMPLVQIASNAESQSKDTLLLANAMWSNEAREWHRIDTGAIKTGMDGLGRFEVLTAREASSEGDPATFIILNESHHMTASSGGHRITQVARRNVGKSPEEMQARLVEYTNAHAMGTDSTAEKSFVAWQQQSQPDKFPNLRQDILYDSIEADPNLRIHVPEELKLAISQAYSDAPWHHADRLEGEVLDPDTSPAEAIRFYLNGLAVREDAWVDPRNWDSLAHPEEVVTDRERIAMFLDCSKSSDATGLVAVRISDGYTFTLGIWQAPKGGRGKGWLAPRHEVDAKVRETFDRYRVMWFGVDPSPATDDSTEANYWMPTIDAWHRDFHRKLKLWATPGQALGHSVKFDMRLSQRGAGDRMKAFVEMAEQVAQWIDEDQGAFFHDGDAALRLHVHNARKRESPWGSHLGKESRDSKKLVDLAVCMVGAHLGRRLVQNNTKIRTGHSTGEPKPRQEVIVL
ncbi:MULTISPECIES: terminase [unclassified Mycolicibacterium]|uniref:terminase n=1 Tax=unclassified Mycolicibacterium TaxID=2636767 RepID=UPI00192E5012|nr:MULTISPECIES: terminase [unclassified Mycolicibacterium]